MIIGVTASEITASAMHPARFVESCFDAWNPAHARHA